ncbi:MAG: glycosyltransferase family 39 protein [Christensenellales bacterium]
MDEFQFKEFSKSLAGGQMYDSTHYPPLYPLVLMPAFLFNDFYFAMKVINGLIAAVTVVAAYRLARLYLGCKMSLFCAALLCMLPFFVLYVPMIRAEPLFLLMTVLAAYFSLRPVNSRNFYWNGIVLGLMVGGMWLTRHVTIALVPGFALFWLYRYFIVEKDIVTNRQKVICMAMILGAVLVAYMPWVLIQISNGHPLSMILGMNVPVDKKMTFSPSWGSLVKWVGLYALYLALAVAPAVTGFLAGVGAWLSRKMKKSDGLFFAFTLMLVAFLVLIAARYSWQRADNYPAVVRVIGRYVVYGAPFLLLGFFIQMKRVGSGQDGAGFFQTLLSLVLACGAVVLGYLVLIEMKVINIESSYMTGTNAAELLPFYSLRGYLLAVALLANGLCAAYRLAARRECKGRPSKRLSTYLRRSTAFFLSLFFILSFANMAFRAIDSPNQDKRENIVYEIRQLSVGREKINFYLNPEGLTEEAAKTPVWYSYGMRFFDFKVARKIYGEDRLTGSNLIVLSAVPLEDKGERLILKKHLVLTGAEYYIYQREE